MADQSIGRTDQRRSRQLTGDDIIAEVLRNCEEGLFKIRYTTVLPCVYHVYLHPADYETIRPVLSALTAEARSALIEKLEALNQSGRPSRLARHLGFDSGKQLEHKILDPDWTIEFHPDIEDKLRTGDIEVYSDLASAPRPEFGEGSMTRLHTRNQPDVESVHSEATAPVMPSAQPVYAFIRYEDSSGAQTYAITKNQIVIGRGGKSFWVDLKLNAPPDVSREHCRLRRDPRTGRFYIKDVSQFGTTLDGKPVPTSIDHKDGEPKDRNLEVPLPARCIIRLADVLSLKFEVQENV